MTISNSTKRRIVNAVGFQFIWFACVLGRNSLLLIPIILIILHLVFVDRRKQESTVLLCAAAVGVFTDTSLTLLGLYQFNQNDIMLGLIPAWLALLWVGLGATLRHSFDYLFQRPLLFPLACGLLAPISYFGGERLGAVELQWQAPPAYFTMAFAWAFAAFALQWSVNWLNDRLGIISTNNRD